MTTTTEPELQQDARARLSTNLKRMRLARGLSQEALGELSGFHRTYVSQVERGVVNISLESVVRLACTLEVDFSLLFRKPRTSKPVVT
jgi:transcriptional regulator with XRE-family HTH domain